jgi:hypothetical protein
MMKERTTRFHRQSQEGLKREYKVRSDSIKLKEAGRQDKHVTS